jgi:hypothetical protein
MQTAYKFDSVARMVEQSEPTLNVSAGLLNILSLILLGLPSAPV